MTEPSDDLLCIYTSVPNLFQKPVCRNFETARSGGKDYLSGKSDEKFLNYVIRLQRIEV